jgi:hypothetical protein
MSTITRQPRIWLTTLLATTMRGRAARFHGLHAGSPSRATCNAQDGVRTPITGHDLAPSPAIVAVGLVLVMATAVAAACSAAYTPQTEISGINVHGNSVYADGAHHRRLRRVR